MAHREDDFEFEANLERLLQMEESGSDKEDYSLRPLNFDEYYGQDQVKENLKIFIKAASDRNEPLDHVLLYGPPGLGKTTLAAIIANELGVNLKVTSGPAIEKAGDLAAILSNLQEKDVLFIDEIHRLNKTVEEILYPAMEDNVLDIMIGKGPSARSLRINIAPFTLVGATTKAGSLSAPLRDRFEIVNRLELYNIEDLIKILQRDALLLNIDISPDALRKLASSSRGTPRIAIRLLKRLRDFAQVSGKKMIDTYIAKQGLSALGIDELGLTLNDKEILKKMISFYQGGPVGLETICAVSGEDKTTVEDMIEPFLLANGFISKTPRGRVVLDKAYEHLGFKDNDK